MVLNSMRMRILEQDKFIKRFMCKEVTTGQLFTSSGQPHPDGLMSSDIFGYTPEEKWVRSGYIKLPMFFIHPEIYRGFFKRRMRDIDNVINGSAKYVITNGELVKDPNGKGGLKWLYDNFDSIKFKAANDNDEDRMMSMSMKRSYNRMTREDVFLNKVIVIPLIFRDISRDGGMTKVDELNIIYQSLISLSSIYSGDVNNMLINRDQIAFKIQLKLVELFNYFVDRTFGKDGIQRKKAMGRNVDYTSRNIISAPKFTGKFGSLPIDLDRVGYPLSAVVGSFTPLFMFNLSRFFRNAHDTGKMPDITPDEFDGYYDMRFCKKLIEKYLKSWSERIDNVSADAGKTTTKVLTFTFNKVNKDGTLESIVRPITLIEILYICAYESVEVADRVTSITRYPILNKYNNVITKIHVLSTIETCRVNIDGIEYPFYPNLFNIEKNLLTKDVVKYEETIGSLFHETIKMSNTYLKGFNADYDGISVAFYSNID